MVIHLGDLVDIDQLDPQILPICIFLTHPFFSGFLQQDSRCLTSLLPVPLTGVGQRGRCHVNKSAPVWGLFLWGVHSSPAPGGISCPPAALFSGANFTHQQFATNHHTAQDISSNTEKPEKK